MRIFLSCQQSLTNHSVPAYQFWEGYFKNGIEEAGHEWVEAPSIDWAEGLTSMAPAQRQKWKDRIWSGVLDFIRHEHGRRPIQLFLSYLFPRQIEPSALRQISSLGICTVNSFCDHVREFTALPEEFKCFDLHWVPEFKAVPFYQSAGLDFIHAPMPVWVHPKQRTWEHPENYGATFIGSHDVLREALFRRAVQLGVELEIRGAGWIRDSKGGETNGSRTSWKIACNQWDFVREQGMAAWMRKLFQKLDRTPSVDGLLPWIKEKPDPNQYIAITQQSIVLLGVNRYPSFRHSLSSPDTYSRLRDLEAPMMGACYLTEWTEGLDQLYDLGFEIETYRSAEEMAQKIQALRGDPEKRRKLRMLGQKRALAEHTIQRSLEKICRQLSIRK